MIEEIFVHSGISLLIVKLYFQTMSKNYAKAFFLIPTFMAWTMLISLLTVLNFLLKVIYMVIGIWYIFLSCLFLKKYGGDRNGC